MKYLAAFLLCIVSFQNVNAQSISLFGIDASNFPTMKAKFYAFDAAGKQVRPSAAELTLTENGQPRSISSVTCPPTKPPIAISSVLTVDVSESMSSDPAGVTNIELAKAAAKAWIQGLRAGQSECALSSFDDLNYLNQDFTTDRSRLLSALSTLSPSGGTDYDIGLLQPLAGSLQISQRGLYKRIVVFLSDGLPNFEPNTAAIIAQAKKQNCMIFAVTLGMPCPKSLKDISSKTGGQWYENVTTTYEAEDVYRKIMQIAVGSEPCELTWTIEDLCEAGNTTVQLQWQSQIATSSYTPPPSAIVSLKVEPNFVVYKKRQPSMQHDTTITLSAQNTDFTVSGISRTFGTADFTIVNTSFPLSIPKNTSKTITLRFAPSDSSLKYASFEIATDKCPGYLSASGGFPGKKATISTLKLTKPNGGETFVVGSDTVITWSGVAPSDTVSLEYTTDNGTTWMPITTSASGLQYLWKNIPNPSSNLCKVRVKQISAYVASAGTPGTEQFKFVGHTNAVYKVRWSPVGSKVVTAGWDKTAIIWSTTTGTKLVTLSGHTDAITQVQWSPDGSKVATTSHDGTAVIWSATSGTKLFTLRHTYQVYDVQWSPDGSKVATASADHTAIIWSTTNGAKIFTLNGHSNWVTSAKWSPDGSKVATASDDQTAIVWSSSSGTKLFTLSGHTARVSGVQWSPDGSKVATSSDDHTARIWSAVSGTNLFTLIHNWSTLAAAAQWSPDGSKVATSSNDSTAIIWSATSGTKLLELNGQDGFVQNVQWSPDGSKVATVCNDSTAIIWSAISGTKLLLLSGHTNAVTAVQWSPDGSKVATASADKTARIWFVEDATIPLQEDTSDSVFSIVAPSTSSQDVDMLQCWVGSGRDAVIATFARNAGAYPYRVDSIQVTGADASQFTLVSGIPPFDVPAGKTRGVEFRFRPTSVGIKTAQVLVFTQADTLRQTIRGEGIAPALRVVGNVIDFGAVEVGKQKDTFLVVTIVNIGSAPLTITNTRHAGPNDVDFTTLAGGGNFTLMQRDTAKIDLRFSPQYIGRTSGRLLFEYNGVGSPATVQLFGEGTTNRSDTARMTVVAQDITAQAGEKVNLILKIEKQTGMHIAGAPTDWYASVHYNKSMLFNEQSQNVCAGTEDSCVLELTGKYNPKTDELISIPCIATLGTTDNSMIIIDDFRWLNSSIITETQTQNGRITITGACEEGGVRLYIPGTQETSLTTRPNPAQNSLQVQYGVREPLTLTLELLNMTGQVVQSIFRDQQKTVGQYLLTSDLSTIGNGIYILRLTTNRGVLTTRVDVVK